MSAGAAAAAAKAAAALLRDERGRKALGWIMVAVFSPIILVIALLCALGAGSAEHNNAAVDACFYGTAFSEKVPTEFRSHVSQMQRAFSKLDEAVEAVNENMENSSLDPIRIKAHFYALCFGENAPSQRAANRFVRCFYDLEERTRTVVRIGENGEMVTAEETYTVAVPRSLEAAYAALTVELEREITGDDQSNARYIYNRIAGTPDSGVYGDVSCEPGGGFGTGGGVEYGGEGGTVIDISGYVDPERKNAADLAVFAVHAWEQGWGYVWGTCGWVLSDSMLEAKLAQYPEGVGNYEGIIRSNWLGRRTADCVGLIKGYGWLDTDSLTVGYAINGMPDVSANQMFHAALVTGTIDTIPEVPGLAVWRDGHIGVYIGNGEIIEAMGTRYGVVKTKLSDGRFTHWLQVPYIDYD